MTVIWFTDHENTKTLVIVKSINISGRAARAWGNCFAHCDAGQSIVLQNAISSRLFRRQMPGGQAIAALLTKLLMALDDWSALSIE